MADVNAANWNAIFYGAGRMDVQKTNELYQAQYGEAGTTPGYTNTTTNPATKANPANMSASANQAQQAATAGGYQLAPGTTGSTTTTPTTQPTTNTPTSQGQIPSSANLSPQDLLNRFLESDPDLMLNMVANHFRAAGASNIFMQWFVNSFRQLWGEFMGHVAEQAANGKVPDLTFKDWVLQFDTQNSFAAQGGARSSGNSSYAYANFASAQGQQ
ncbi:MAG: hypothetical protein ACSLE3_10110 [Microbacteriaceae bacterium]